MTRYFIQRPIAVIMSFVALIALSVLAWLNRPVSLLPDVDVPEMAIRVEYANASPEAIESSVLKPMRESLATMQGLASLQSVASNENGLIRMRFEYGQRMDLAFVEVNEKIDRLTDQFPASMERPKVIRINYTDIPIARIQISPKNPDEMAENSLLVENVIKKRIEQIAGVSLVDLNGTVQDEIKIIPDLEALKQVNVPLEAITNAIQSANQELGGVAVKDGQYEYYMRMAGRLNGPADIALLPIKVGESSYMPLSSFASVEVAQEEAVGFHLFNQQQSIVMNVHKQPAAVMTELMPEIKKSLEQFEKDYKSLEFAITQDQSVFLKAGIQNLQTSLLFGGAFAFVVLFLFMGSYRLPLIMGISLPLSLILSFLFFELFNLSINIISLSGLALGLGMLIDNAIIVLENISRKRLEGLSLVDACVQGVGEVRSALISSVLTTLAVFIPLIFLSGISGVLFYDQAVSVAIILSVSLIVSFVMLPLLYKLFFSKKSHTKKEDSRFFSGLLSLFKKTHHWSFQHKTLSFILIALIIPLGVWSFINLKQEGLPQITRNDAVIKVRWNEPIGIEENKRRSIQLLQQIEKFLAYSEVDGGIPQYLLSLENSELQESTFYVAFENENDKTEAISTITSWLAMHYREAAFEAENAKNAFDMLFSSDDAFLEVKWQDPSLNEARIENITHLLEQFPVEEFKPGPSLEQESSMILTINQRKLLQYGINSSQLILQLERVLGDYKISELKQFAVITPVVFSIKESTFKQLIEQAEVQNENGERYALDNFIEYEWGNRLKKITADLSGPYFSVAIEEETSVVDNMEKIDQWANENGLLYQFDGRYFTDQENLKELSFILLISIILLYFILSAQFESFWQPLLVIISLPFGLFGAFILLNLFGSTINIMSAIGMIVMLGIMVNDAILKVDTMNRLMKERNVKQASQLYEIVLQAGTIRLKPILMTSITTLLALSPVLLSGGLGAELQTPLVLSVMGGLTIGTLTALYLIPLLYYQIKSGVIKKM